MGHTGPGAYFDAFDR